MIKKYLKITVSVLMAAAILLMLPPFIMHAADMMSSCRKMNGNGAVVMTVTGTSADEYGFGEWESLQEAMNYYGTGYTYHAVSNPFLHICTTTNNGNVYTYTHYYTFSDGSRMYFGVRSL